MVDQSIEIKRLPDKKKLVTIRQVSIDGEVFSLDELIANLDDLYCTKNRYEYCEIPKNYRNLLAKYNVIEYHSGGSWKSTNFDLFYKKIYELIN